MKPTIIAFMNAYSHGKSGGDMVFLEIAKRLDYPKKIITSRLGQELCKAEGVHAQFYITSHENTFRNIIKTYIKRTWNALCLSIKVHDADILLGSSDFLPDVMPLWWLKINHKKTRWIQHIFHLIPSSRKIPHWSQKLSFFFIKHAANTVVVDNHLLKDELTHMGFNPKKIIVNYPGIDLDYFRSIKTAEHGYDGVFIGQLRISKGIFDLIPIWKHISKTLPEARLAIIGKGSGDTIKKLHTMIQESNLEKNIEILGFVENDRAFPLLKTAKVFVFPSHEEGFGIAAVEAQALGVPAVAWDLPIFDEIFPRGMVYVTCGNIHQFAHKVIELLRDTRMREKLSHEALENAARFEWSQTYAREHAIIQQT